jgi:hypothetical protein
MWLHVTRKKVDILCDLDSESGKQCEVPFKIVDIEQEQSDKYFQVVPPTREEKEQTSRPKKVKRKVKKVALPA